MLRPSSTPAVARAMLVMRYCSIPALFSRRLLSGPDAQHLGRWFYSPVAFGQGPGSAYETPLAYACRVGRASFTGASFEDHSRDRTVAAH